MTLTEPELEDELSRIEDPEVGGDIVSLGLVNAIHIEDGTATVSLAFNTPYAPDEMAIGDEVRDLISEHGLEPQLRAQPKAEHGFDTEVMPDVRNVIAVASGKGGVGKTTVACNIAAGLEKLGATVGILDADIHGPNVPRILTLEGDPEVTPGEMLVPPTSDGVRVASMGFLMDDPDDPAMLRGPMVNKFMMQFLEGVQWGKLDYLVVDLPPGTGDASFDLLQNVPVTGAVIVTTPQDMSLADARKGLRMFREHDAPILGVVENMSTFRCESCGDEHSLFGANGADEISEDYDVPIISRLPLHSDFGEGGTDGAAVKDDDSPVQDDASALVEQAVNRLSEVNRRTVAENVSPKSLHDSTVPTSREAGADEGEAEDGAETAEPDTRADTGAGDDKAEPEADAESDEDIGGSLTVDTKTEDN
ncbi:Mrp/NBP35 family ATP-binding protein [Natrialbaceae archaeon A-gly3]